MERLISQCKKILHSQILGENFTLTKIAKKTLSDDDGNYELCRYSKEEFLKLDTLDPNIGMRIGNVVKRDKSLVEEFYEFEIFPGDEITLEVLFKDFRHNNY